MLSCLVLIKSIETDTPDFILMCFAFESANGVSYISRLRQIAPNTPVIVLSATFRSIEVISSLYQSGAASYLCTTTCTLDLLFEAFDAIQRVGYFFPPDLLKQGQAHAFAQLLDLDGNRWLSQVQGLRRPRETAQSGNRG